MLHTLSSCEYKRWCILTKRVRLILSLTRLISEIKHLKESTASKGFLTTRASFREGKVSTANFRVLTSSAELLFFTMELYFTQFIQLDYFIFKFDWTRATPRRFQFSYPINDLFNNTFENILCDFGCCYQGWVRLIFWQFLSLSLGSIQFNLVPFCITQSCK